jgi:hypothetical protein
VPVNTIRAGPAAAPMPGGAATGFFAAQARNGLLAEGYPSRFE